MDVPHTDRAVALQERGGDANSQEISCTSASCAWDLAQKVAL